MEIEAIELNTRVSKIMVSPVMLINADSMLSDAARFLISHKISGAPVVEDDGKAVGVLTLKDIARFAMIHLKIEDVSEEMSYFLDDRDTEEEESDAEEAFEQFEIEEMKSITVRQVMTPYVITVEKTSTLKEALEKLLKNRIHRIFVKSRGKIVGVITTFDIIRWLRDTLQ